MNDNAKNDARRFAKDIADCLKWDFPPDQDGWSLKICNPQTQAMLWIHVEQVPRSQNTRVVISAGFGDLTEYAPYDSRGKYRISCTSTKTPPQICNDIRRRIFPGYFADLQIAKERYAAHVERMKGLAIASLKFAAILNIPPIEPDNKEEVQLHLGFVTSEQLWGDVRIGTQDVDIKLTDVPFHVAAMMLVPLGEYIKAHPKERGEPEAEVCDAE
jgi:hypothetical protein